MRRSRLILVVFCGLACAGVLGAVSRKASELPTFKPPDLSKSVAYRVVRVIDEDTIIVAADGTDPFKVRLIGVDTPETIHPSKPVQHYGKEASRFTTNLLKGERVHLVYEGDKPTRDKSARVLAYVYRAPDGLFVNAEIIRQGYGHAYVKFPFKYLEQLRQLERFARQAEKGLWGPRDTAVFPANPPVMFGRPPFGKPGTTSDP